jgi:hypothetical protein
MKKEELLKVIERIQWILERDRGRRIDQERDRWKADNKINERMWELNNYISIHRQELDQLRARIHMLEDTEKRRIIKL